MLFSCSLEHSPFKNNDDLFVCGNLDCQTSVDNIDESGLPLYLRPSFRHLKYIPSRAFKKYQLTLMDYIFIAICVWCPRLWKQTFPVAVFL